MLLWAIDIAWTRIQMECEMVLMINENVWGQRICYVNKEETIYLQETKIEITTKEILRSICPLVNWWVLGAVGSAGGILLMFDKRLVEIVDYVVGEFSGFYECLERWKMILSGLQLSMAQMM